MSDILVYGVGKVLHWYSEYAHIYKIKGVRDLELEDVGIPASHIPKLDFHLDAAFLEVSFQFSSLVISDGRAALPAASLECFGEEFVEGLLVGGEAHSAASPGSRLWGGEEWHGRAIQDAKYLLPQDGVLRAAQHLIGEPIVEELALQLSCPNLGGC